MKRQLGIGALVALVGWSSAWAQERTAGQAYDAQVNWSALSSKLDLVINQNKVLATTVTALSKEVDSLSAKLDAAAACGKQQKLWTGSGCANVPSGAMPTYGQVPYTSGTPVAACRKYGYKGVVSFTPIISGAYVPVCMGQDCTVRQFETRTTGYTLFCYK